MKMHAFLLLLLACNTRSVADEEHVLPPDVAVDDEGDDDIGDDGHDGTFRLDVGSDGCPGDLADCDGECVDLMSDIGNCGVCGHRCADTYLYGFCAYGSCPPVMTCRAFAWNETTCADVCAYYGQECVDYPAHMTDYGTCSNYLLTFDEGDRSALEACEMRTGTFVGLDASCETAIDWSITGPAGSPAGAVACCCTQEPE